VCLLTTHDAPEALLGDLPRSASELWPPGAKRSAEERAAQAVLAPLGAFAHACQLEYAAGATREARFARACDKLQMALRCLGYVRAGARGLEDFERALDGFEQSEFSPCAHFARELREAFAAEKRA
jgi:putative hydrolase of HD superfamily